MDWFEAQDYVDMLLASVFAITTQIGLPINAVLGVIWQQHIEYVEPEITWFALNVMLESQRFKFISTRASLGVKVKSVRQNIFVGVQQMSLVSAGS